MGIKENLLHVNTTKQKNICFPQLNFRFIIHSRNPTAGRLKILKLQNTCLLVLSLGGKTFATQGVMCLFFKKQTTKNWGDSGWCDHQSSRRKKRKDIVLSFLTEQKKVREKTLKALTTIYGQIKTQEWEHCYCQYTLKLCPHTFDGIINTT